MNKNILLCVLGLTLGFGGGFFLANKVTGTLPAAPASAAANAPRAAPDSAPPLDPNQAGAPLPPGHPDINNAAAGGGTNANPNGVAATNAEAQSAMEAADRKPKDFDLQMDAATVFYKLKAYDKAALYLGRAVELKPKDTDALVALGNTKYDAGDFPTAATFYERALALQPQNADVQTDLGNTYFQRQPPDYRRAIEEYRKTLKIDPRHEKALQNIAAAALQLGDKTIAREAVQQLAAVNPANPTLAALRTRVEEMP
ncbi:MAG TPA: tetratricopeptide repeat protein [Pyrinomonadaceae bacterium]|nr:tetratricopeptide repeat protein [Pyrinomonadaceae bacterium]